MTQVRSRCDLGDRNANREQVVMRLHAVAIQLLRRVRKDDPMTGLTPARSSLLSILVFGGPRTMGQLAGAEQVTPATISRLVDGLAADGFVLRRPDSQDGRVTIVVATPKARKCMEKARARRVVYLAQLLNQVPAEGWGTLSEAIALLEKALHSGD